MKTNTIICLTAVLAILCSCGGQISSTDTDIHVAAYIWPSCHDDSLGRAILWEEGDGEWQVIKRGDPRFEGHYQPKEPLWGYEHDDDPAVMEKWIDLATSHGIDTFIFDWYWFDGQPFLEGCLDNGFLKAPNNQKMNFYCMWANHNVARNYWNYHRYGDDNSRLWTGVYDWDNYAKVIDRVISQYFSLPNYLKIDGKPVFAIYSVDLFLENFGGDIAKAREGVDYFRAKVKEAGFPDLYLQFMAEIRPELIPTFEALGADCTTQYGWTRIRTEDYNEWAENGIKDNEEWGELWHKDHFPTVGIGWDDTPRYPAKGQQDVVHIGKTPENFAKALARTKEYFKNHPDQPKYITVYAFNEWIEDAYLLPDKKNGYDYINAVRDVMNSNSSSSADGIN